LLTPCTLLLASRCCDLVLQARRTFDRALAALPITQHDRVWVLYLVSCSAELSQWMPHSQKQQQQQQRQHDRVWVPYLVSAQPAGWLAGWWVLVQQILQLHQHAWQQQQQRW
jgi:hypothetical protein